jgi:hypothetical protein
MIRLRTQATELVIFLIECWYALDTKAEYLGYVTGNAQACEIGKTTWKADISNSGEVREGSYEGDS